MWAAFPSSIPGVRPSVYFWDLPNNKTSRAVAGLSACNETEANAVTSLSKWLILCGTPPSSISIITPYKGQKSLLIKKLRAAKIIPAFSAIAPPPGSTLTVSTVDRYQGDENDIIIYSNVRTQAGNKFVTLKNRFIVTTSRARLGFYLVGSVSALIDAYGRSSSTSHWSIFITSLKRGNSLTWSSNQGIRQTSSELSIAECENDTDSQSEEDDEEEDVETEASTPISKTNSTSDCTFLGSRVGSMMPICCPRHRNIVKQVKSDSFPTSETWGQFCKLPCSNILQLCGHPCPLSCHSPVTRPHAIHDECVVPLVRACMRHSDIPLLCKEISIAKHESLSSAIARADCLIIEEYVRVECNHVVQMTCHTLGKFVRGEVDLPKCVIIVKDFIQPTCGHRITAPTCFDCREYEIQPPVCSTIVKFTRPCGCETIMPCHKSYSERKIPTLCMSQVHMTRPRCAHLMSLRCHVGRKLRTDWDDQDGESVTLEGIITFGTLYGPSEKMLSYNSRPQILACEAPCLYRASCGHISTDILCNTAFEMAAGRVAQPKCESMVTLASPVCGHSVKVPCWVQGAIEKWSPWGTNKSTPEIIEESSLVISDTEEVAASVKHILKKACQQSVRIFRSCGSGHEITVKCTDLHSHLVLGTALPDCVEPVQKLLDCSHHKIVRCCEENGPSPACYAAVKDVFVYPCGEHYVDRLTCDGLSTLRRMSNPLCPSRANCRRFRCGHDVIAACHLRSSIEESVPGAFLQRVDVGEAVVIAGAAYCPSADTIPPCRNAVTYRAACGHDRSGVACADAFAWADGRIPYPRCDEMVTRQSPVCGHSIELPCWSNDLLREWRPWPGVGELMPIANADMGADVLPDFEVLSHCDQYGQTVDVISVAHDHREPTQAPVPHKMLVCDGSAMLLRGECVGTF
jgi:AAA domain